MQQRDQFVAIVSSVQCWSPPVAVGSSGGGESCLSQKESSVSLDDSSNISTSENSDDSISDSDDAISAAPGSTRA